MSTVVKNLVVPEGYIAVERDGRVIVERSGETLSKTMAFRVTPSTYSELVPFFESFPDGSPTSAFRWLLEHDDVRALMADRIRAQAKPRRRAR
jgi:hypothetical protein